MRPAGSSQELERRRQRAIALLKSGHPPKDVAERVGVDRRSVRRWHAAFRNGGEDTLKARKTPGRPPRLTSEQKRDLEEILLQGPKVSGFSTDLWTCARVAQVIQERFDVRYHADHVGRLLHALGWTPQKPERRAMERDEARIEGGDPDRLARSQKKPKGKGPGSLSSTNPACL